MNIKNKNELPIAFLYEQIDKLVEQIAIEIRDENAKLKQKIAKLQNENARLLKLLYLIQEKSFKSSSLEFFIKSNKNDLLNW